MCSSFLSSARLSFFHSFIQTSNIKHNYEYSKYFEQSFAKAEHTRKPKPISKLNQKPPEIFFFDVQKYRWASWKKVNYYEVWKTIWKSIRSQKNGIAWQLVKMCTVFRQDSFQYRFSKNYSLSFFYMRFGIWNSIRYTQIYRWTFINWLTGPSATRNIRIANYRFAFRSYFHRAFRWIKIGLTLKITKLLMNWPSRIARCDFMNIHKNTLGIYSY